jgi:DNA-binding NarL/FixJ family response regulator
MTVRLLVVDDTEHVRRMLTDILQFHGFEIAGQASDGEEAVRMAQESEPDIVVMDLRMPGTDGLEAARRIREVQPDQAVILYSAYLDHEVEKRAREVGVAVCVPKLSGVEALAREISALAMDLGR